ncbi:MAG: hypothetical protein J1F33_06965 [Clostridiales bacterium]|nr:hypothetical protein [Clostridiales bacterium]
MKKVVMSFVSVFTAIAVSCLCACAVAESNLLGAPKNATSLTYEERQDGGLIDLADAANAFSYGFSEQAYSSYGKGENLAVTPLSVYMALAVAAECAQSTTRGEILSALNTNYDNLKENFSKLYRSVILEDNDFEGLLRGKLAVTNSIWLNSGVRGFKAKDKCIDSLSDNFYCYSYAADFTNSNKNANLALKEFVSQQTNNMVNRDFDISKDSSFLLINTLYLHDLWDMYGDELRFVDGKYNFTTGGGKKQTVRYMQGDYSSGRAYEDEKFTSFYTSTYHGFKIKFILPRDGYSVADVFTAENIKTINTLGNYNARDDENRIYYHTRCFFPEFGGGFDGDVKGVLKKRFGIKSMFDPDASDFSAVSDSKNYCSEVRHTVNLKVTKKGIEGAAVTILDLAGSPPPFKDDYTDVYEDFIVDRAFGYVITNRDDTVLFAGAVNNV